jgi:hypothetical protein
MYCPYQNFNSYEICASKVHLALYKILDSIRWRTSFESHLWAFGMVFVAKEVSASLYSLCMYDLRWHMKPIMLGRDGRYCGLVWCLVIYELVWGD